MAETLEEQLSMFSKKWQECEDELQICREALHNEEIKRNDLQTDNKKLTAAIQRSEDEYSKLEKHTKNCEKATEKAQKETKFAAAHADNLINSQKSQLKKAEWKYETTASDLKNWTDKYGSSVDKPANDKHDLQLKVFEWQSKAEKACNEIALLEAQIQGSPEQVGLHQALEEWEEHQACSAELGDLQDRLHDEILRRQESESDLSTSKQRHQKTKSDLKASQIKAAQFEQAYNSIKGQDKISVYSQRIRQLESDLQASEARHQKSEEDKKVLQEKADQLEKTDETSRGQEGSDFNLLEDHRLEKQKLESDLKTFQERYYKAESDVKSLQEKSHWLEQANQALKDQDNSRIDMLQKLESDQNANREQLQKTELDRKTLQEKAGQLEVDLRTAEERLQTAKSEKEVLQEKAHQMETNLIATKERYETEYSYKMVHQEKAHQLGLDLEKTKEQYQTTKSMVETLQIKTHQLEQANELLQEQVNERLQAKTFDKKENDQEGHDEVADTVRRDEERMKLLDLKSDSEDAEQNRKNQRLRIQTPKEANRVQVTPPLSPMYTSSEGSSDWEKTPRPRISLRQDLGYSSQDASDEEQFSEGKSDAGQSVEDRPQQGGADTLRLAKTGEEKEPGADTWMSEEEEEDEEDADDGSERQGEKILISLDRRATFPPPLFAHDYQRRPKSLNALELRARDRAKEQSEILETLFECTPTKANTIDRRLKALGPGCRLLEAPALVAFELSGIREDVYKGLASGQLIATMPPNEVNDMGTNPDAFSNDMSTDTTDLPSEAVAGPLSIANDMATDTADLTTEDIAIPPSVTNDAATDTAGLPLAEASALTQITFLSWNSIPQMWRSLIISFGLLCLYMWLKPDAKANDMYEIMYTGYSHRHVPFRTPSLNASTRVTYQYPPLPAPQLGWLRMMNENSAGGRLKGSKW